MHHRFGRCGLAINRMRILITGSTGFIGSHLVERLASDHELYGLARRAPTKPHAQVCYIYQDLAQPLDYKQLPAQLDAIIHQAAVINTETVDATIPFLVNVVAAWRLLAYAADAGVSAFVHASTGGIYGCGPHPFHETDLPNPMDLYSLTKAQAELALLAAEGSFRKVTLRYFFPYGVGTPNPIPGYVAKAVRGEPIPIMAGGGPKFNPIHISDAVEATVRALSVQGDRTLNIAGSEIATFASIAEMAGEMAGRKVEFQSYPVEQAIPYYQSDLVASTEQMQASLHLTPQVPLKVAIAELVASNYNDCQ